MLFRNLYRCASCSGRMAGCVECYMRRRLPALRRAHSCRGGPGVRILGVKILPEAREAPLPTQYPEFGLADLPAGRAREARGKW